MFSNKRACKATIALSLLAFGTSGAAFAQFTPHKQVWYRARTSTGCIIMLSTVPDRVAIDKKQERYFWDGAPCSPNVLITGTGTLRKEINEGGTKWTSFEQGKLESGIFVGVTTWWTSYFPDRRHPSEMLGGCEKATYLQSGCQPRLVGKPPNNRN